MLYDKHEYLDVKQKIQDYANHYNFPNNDPTTITLPNTYTDGIWPYMEYRVNEFENNK